MQPDEVMDSLAHAFQLEKIRREVNECESIEILREMVMVLVDVNEKQKAMFRKLIIDLHEPA
jgi:hypothetical protein